MYRQFIFALLAFPFLLISQKAQSFTELQSNPKSDVYMQAFYWNSPPGGIWWDSLAAFAPRLASAGFSGVWLPNAVKGAGGGMSMGYDPYDHYDFGEFNQKGSRETRFGSRQELINAINTFHNVGMQVYADAVLRHMMGGEDKVPYQCRPIHNGNFIVPDSAYLSFQYPNGSGRFRKDAGSFYPNSVNCWVDPLFVQTDPLFRFGEWLDHNKPAIRDSLKAWGQYLRNVLGFDGFRLDAVKPIDPAFMADWLNNVNGTNYAVAELWGSISEIGSWLNVAKNQNGATVAMFDFPLRYTLKDMCNTTSGAFDMRNLDGAGLVNAGFSGFDVSTFVENHDFDRKGWDGSIDNGHDPILTNKDMGYAYIIFSEGRPTVFFKDYVDYGVGGKIDTLIWIRQNFLGGGTTKRTNLNAYYIRQDGSVDQNALAADIYVAKRNGFGTQPGGFLVINDNPNQWIDVWVDTDKPVGTWYKDYTGRDVNKQVVGPIGSGPNRIKLWAPPRSYTIYVPDTTKSINNPPVMTSVPDQVGYTNSRFAYQIKVSDVNNDPLNFQLTGNPSWLSVSSTGLLQGTPAFSDTGLTNIVISISDNKGGAISDTFSIRIWKNLAPVITDMRDTTIKATKRFEYQASATDADGDTIRYFFRAAPNFLNVEALTGFISGTPSLEDTGIYNVNLQVTDGKGAYDSTLFVLNVIEAPDTIILTYAKPNIDGNINVTSGDWRQEWLVVSDSDTDSYWRPVDTLNNEMLAIYSTWDADSLYIGIDYVINDPYNTMVLYLEAGLPGGVTNFNSTSGYNGDYAKNFRFRADDAIDFFVASYFRTAPLFYRITGNTSENMTELTNGVRGDSGRGVEVAVSWNDLYGLGAGRVPHNVKLKMVGLVAGGFNYGAGDSAPDNPDVNGNAGPDSLIYLAMIEPDKDTNGIPDPTVIITGIDEGESINSAPADYALMQNFPNPFNPSTSIRFDLPERSFVELKIYDILGAVVRSYLGEEMNAGSYSLRVEMGNLPSGIYFYQITTPKFNQVRKMVLVK